jgi:glycosyltransferase involved in cell wall biosynthesis
MRVAIVSPDPEDNSNGLERFCHSLNDVLNELGSTSTVVRANELGQVPHDVAISNGMFSGRTRAPRIHVYHGCWVDQVRLGSNTARYSLPWKTRFLLRGAAKEMRGGWGAYRVAVSERTAAELSRWYRYRIHRVIPNGVDTSIFVPGDRAAARAELGLAPDERLALFIGRAEPRKRPDIAVTAADRAGYRLLIAGSRTVAGTTSLGVLPPATLRTWIQAVDCVLAPTDYEACSLAILEALSGGTAVVTTRVGYIPTLIDQVPAYADLTVPAGDVEGFTRALMSLSDKSAAVAEATSFVRKENSLDTFGRRWADTIEEVLRIKAHAGTAPVVRRPQ